MHIEPPGHAPQSLKDFGVHYLMIVIGILTAVGIEQGIEAIHHNELASQAILQIEEELKGNLHSTSSTLAENKKRLVALRATEEALTKDISQKDVSAETFMTRVRSIAIGAATPSLRRDAWDAAIASQALTYVEPATVRRYSAAYSAERDTTATILATLAIGNWPGQLQSAVVDAKLGKVDQVGLLKALATYEMALAATAENEWELEEALKTATKEPSSPGRDNR